MLHVYSDLPTYVVSACGIPQERIFFFSDPMYEGWNFNSGNYLFTTNTKWIHVSKFYCPSL